MLREPTNIMATATEEPIKETIESKEDDEDLEEGECTDDDEEVPAAPEGADQYGGADIDNKENKKSRRDSRSKDSTRLKKELNADEEKKRLIKEKLRQLERQMAGEDEEFDEEELDDELDENFGGAMVGGPWVDGSSGVFALSDHDKDVPSCFRFAHPAEAIFLFSVLRTAHRGHLRLGGLGAWRLSCLEAWRAWSLEGLEAYWPGALLVCCLWLAMGIISQGLPSQPPTHPTPSHPNHPPR